MVPGLEFHLELQPDRQQLEQPLWCQVSNFIWSCSRTGSNLNSPSARKQGLPPVMGQLAAEEPRCTCAQSRLHHAAALHMTADKRLGWCLYVKGRATHLALQAVLPREGKRLVAERFCLGGGPPCTAGHGSLRRADAGRGEGDADALLGNVELQGRPIFGNMFHVS